MICTLLALIVIGRPRVPNVAVRAEMTKLLHENVIEASLLEFEEVLFKSKNPRRIKYVIKAFRESDRVKGEPEPLVPGDVAMGEPPTGKVLFKIRRKSGIERFGFRYVSVEIPNYFGKSVMDLYRKTLPKRLLRSYEKDWKAYAVN
jgi:hypothetical protein